MNWIYYLIRQWTRLSFSTYKNPHHAWCHIIETQNHSTICAGAREYLGKWKGEPCCEREIWLQPCRAGTYMRSPYRSIKSAIKSLSGSSSTTKPDNILQISGKKVRLVVSLPLTSLYKHLHAIEVVEDYTCRICCGNEENSQHVLG